MEIIIPRYIEKIINVYPQPEEIGFTPRVLVQATMPHSDPLKVREWSRENGLSRLHMEAGPGSSGLPFGSIPRLLLAWTATEVKRKKQQTIILGPSLSHFLMTLGMQSTGGKNGTNTRMKEQLIRLFSAVVATTFEKKDDNLCQLVRQAFLLSEDMTILWDPKKPEEIKWPSEIKLSKIFYNDLLSNTVPLDLNTLRALKTSPLALDIYSWLTDRMCRLKRETKLTWGALQLQFGADYQNNSSGRQGFKRNFKKHLETVKICYPEAKIEAWKDGIILKKSSPHVKKLSTESCGYK